MKKTLRLLAFSTLTLFAISASAQGIDDMMRPEKWHGDGQQPVSYGDKIHFNEGKPTKLFGFELYTGDYTWDFIKDGIYYMVDLKQLEKKRNGEDCPFAARATIGKGLQKNMDETMKDVEKALEDPEVQKQIEKAAKEMSK